MFYGFEECFRDNGIPESDIENVMRWAFGEDYKRVDCRDIGSKWRELHPDVMILDSTLVEDAAAIIAREWRKQEAA